jgi:hypothetical protein
MTDANELIRAAFERAAAADPTTDGGGVADAVRSAASRADKKERAESKAKEREPKEPKEPKEPRDRGRLVMALGGVGLALALVGGVLTVALGGSGEESLTTANQTVHMYRCPGSEPVGTLRRGDVVRSLARSGDSKWLAVTFPNDVAEQVWVPAHEVSSDVPTSNLPVARCTAKNAVEIAGKKTSPSKSSQSTASSKPAAKSGATTTTARTTSSSTTTTVKVTTNAAPPRGGTSNPGPSPTVAPPPPPTPHHGPPTTAPPTTSPPPPPTTTVPPDITPPLIASATSSPAQIYSNNGICSASTPKTSLITAVVSDASGIQSVTIAWRWNGVLFPDQNGATSRTMSSSGGGSYVASFGKFGDVQHSGVTLVVTVTATDKAGNTSTKKLNIAVFSCHT